MDINANINVQAEGIFSRNYSEDLINIEKDVEGVCIALSRDGIFHLLPERLFFGENLLQSEGKRNFNFEGAYDQLKRKKKDILSFFQPFDSAFFKLSLDLERKLNDLTRIDNTFVPYPLPAEPNKYIRKIKNLLPFAAQLKGNESLIIDILKNVFSVEKVEIRKIKPLHTRVIIQIEGLSKEEYIAMDEELAAFFDFFCHWFLPIEQQYDYRIKGYKQPLRLGDLLILDYNTHL